MKTMKKVLCVALCLVATLTLVACGDDSVAFPTEGPWNDTVTDWPSADNDDDAPVYAEPAGEKYETNELTPYGKTAAMKDTFDRFADDNQNMFFTTDGTLMHSETLETDFWFSGKDPEEVVAVWNDPAYKDDKGFLYIRDDGKEFPCQDIRGEIFWQFTGMLSGELVICSVDSDGYMYQNSIDRTGIKSRDNEKLYLYDCATETYMEKVDFVRVVQDDQIQCNIYAEVDGKAYYSNITGIYNFKDKPQIWVNSNFDMQPAENVMAYGYGGANSVLYKKDGDSSAAYYTYGFGSKEMPVFMPAGKTVDQLTKVSFGDTTILVFNDGSVYRGELVHTVVGPEMVLDETLTALNQAGAIRELYQSNFYKGGNAEIRILMDDNVTYVYTPAA